MLYLREANYEDMEKELRGEREIIAKTRQSVAISPIYGVVYFGYFDNYMTRIR